MKCEMENIVNQRKIPLPNLPLIARDRRPRM